MMNRLSAYQNSIWLADGERFQRHIQAALHKPCPSSAQIRERHREMMELAKNPPTMQGAGVDLDIHAEAPRAIRATKAKVGILPVFGPIAQRMSAELEKTGGTPLDFVSAAFDSLLDNPSVSAIVMQFDSPGGSVDGVEELADKIYAARDVKPIYAIADSTAASAALWLASAATMFLSTPAGGSATVGSHGIYVMHVDESAALEKEGVKVTMVSAGKYKTEFAPYGPITDEAKSEAQARVNGIYDQFTAALKRNRDTTMDHVRQNYGQGRMLTAQQALAAGMIDRVMSMAELMSKLTGGSPKVTGRGPSAEKLRLLHELEESN